MTDETPRPAPPAGHAQHDHHHAGDGHCCHGHAKPAPAPEGKVKDPVCGMWVDPASTPHKTAFEGREVFFCSAGCKAKFEKEPQRYTEDKPKPQPDYSAQLQKAVTVQGMLRHERALANIAERNNNTRASGTAGFNKSRDYVVGQLQAAGYDVTVQPFDFPYFEESSPSTLATDSKTYTEGPGKDFNIMQYSGSGDVTAPLVAVDLTLPPADEPSSTSGCEAADFAGFPAGAVALIQRGTCPFGDKVDNAVAAGASAVIIFNEGQEGRTDSQGRHARRPQGRPGAVHLVRRRQ